MPLVPDVIKIGDTINFGSMEKKYVVTVIDYSKMTRAIEKQQAELQKELNHLEGIDQLLEDNLDPEQVAI